MDALTPFISHVQLALGDEYVVEDSRDFPTPLDQNFALKVTKVDTGSVKYVSGYNDDRSEELAKNIATFVEMAFKKRA